MRFYAVFLFLSEMILTCSAQEVFTNNKNIEEALKSTYEPNYFSMILGLLTVIFLVYITGFIYQKLIKIKIEDENVHNKATVISTTPLGQNKALYVIKINDEYSLLGVCQNNISYLKDIKFTDKENKE